MVPDLGGVGPPNSVVTVVSSDFSLEEKALDDPYHPGTPSNDH